MGEASFQSIVDDTGRKQMKKQRVIKPKAGFTSASFFALAEHAPDIICRFDRQYYHLYVNPAIEKATGLPVSAFIGKTIAEVGMSPEFAAFWITQIESVFNKKKQSLFEFDFSTPEGSKYFQSSVVPEYDDKGNIVSVLSISRDITPIRQSEKEKDALIAMVTHELKTPITSVKAFAQLLGKQLSRDDNKANTTYLTKMDKQLNRLNKLIGDLLDATRIGAGKMQFHESLFSFNQLLREVVNDIRKTTKTHPIIMKKMTPVKVFADRDRIGQVLLNLLSNAIKYSPDSLPVIVSMHGEGEILTCCIQNFGPVIPKEMQGRLFQKFSRLTKKSHKDSPGLGLGLYISAEIIKTEGGKIWVESPSLEGKGTTFCFTLPAKGEEKKGNK